MKRQGEELLTAFYRKGYDPKVIPVDLERGFKIRISPDLTFGGKVDRVDQLPGGKIEIIDYTNQPRQQRVEIDNVPAERGVGLTQNAIA